MLTNPPVGRVSRPDTAAAFVRVLCLGCLMIPGLPGISPAQNMVANGGFEEGASSWGLPQPLYAVDSTVAHSGAGSLKYHNEPGGPYLIAGQGLPLRSGKCYRMSAWVKTEGIASTDTGATISMEWSGKEGYIGGAYPPGIMGTSDWQQIVFFTSPVPEGVTGGSVIAYGRPGTSGTAWFDDLEVVEFDGPVARLHFADTPPGQTGKQIAVGVISPEVRLQADLLPAAGVSPDRLDLSVTPLVPGAPKHSGGVWHGTTAELAFPTDTLPLGATQLEVSLVSNTDGRPVTSTYLSIEKRQLLSLSVLHPNSAGVVGVGPEKDERVVLRLTILPQTAGKARTYRARLTPLSEGKAAGRSVGVMVTDRGPSRAEYSFADLPYGIFDLRCDLLLPGGSEPIARAQVLVTHADPSKRPANATWIGPNRMLMVEGKPFLPIGFYILSSFETVFPADQPYRWQAGKLCPSYYLPILDRLSKSRFNCVMDYGSTMGGLDQARQFLDAAQARGVRAIFSAKDLMHGAFWEPYTQNLLWKDLREATRNVVGELRNHPSLIAWYINDEVTAPDMWPGAVNVFRDTRETDPWHPTWAVHYDYTHLTTYREACDIIGTDPYTLTGDIGFAARDWHDSREQLPPEQPFWAVVQCFGPGYESSRPAADPREPSYDEERAATMAAIAEGATGIIYYCYHSLQRSPRFEERFAELDRIAGEVASLLPIVSLPNASRLAQLESGTLSVLTKQGKDGVYVLLASTMRTDQDAVLDLPLRPRSVRDVTTGEMLKPDGHRLALHFKALDARVLEVR